MLGNRGDFCKDIHQKELAETLTLVFCIYSQEAEVNCRESNIVLEIIIFICGWQFGNTVCAELKRVIANNIRRAIKMRTEYAVLATPSSFLRFVF